MLRNSFLEPIEDLELAAKLLDAAADALFVGDRKLAVQLIVLANRPSIMEYAIQIVGKLSDDVHRQTKLPKTLPEDRRDRTRMPNKAVQYSIFSRDGWRCRYCETKVFSKAARSRLVAVFPEETNWGAASEFQRHSALYAMATSLDHIVPHSRGGLNDVSNFATACFCCQFGRGHFILDEVAWSDPLQRPPIVDGWDGLSRLESHFA